MPMKKVNGSHAKSRKQMTFGLKTPAGTVCLLPIGHLGTNARNLWFWDRFKEYRLA
jgi:hypothetical protein